MLTNMSDGVNNVANVLRETGPAHVDANLYLAVIEMPGFLRRPSLWLTPSSWTTRPKVGAL